MKTLDYFLVIIANGVIQEMFFNERKSTHLEAWIHSL